LIKENNQFGRVVGRRRKFWLKKWIVIYMLKIKNNIFWFRFK
jgi:hypothetical protein